MNWLDRAIRRLWGNRPEIRDYYTAGDVRELDRLAIEEHSIPGFELMRRAGQAAFNRLLETWPGTESVVLYCGTGNNGGDGFIIAGLAVEAGLSAEIRLIGDANKLMDDALLAYQYACNFDVPVLKAGAPAPQGDNTVIVDALLGTGLSGEVRPSIRAIIEEINQSKLPVLSVDIPSGLSSDTGDVLGAAVKADLTVTFIGRKVGQVRGEGPRRCGRCVYESLDVPNIIFSRVTPAVSE